MNNNPDQIEVMHDNKFEEVDPSQAKPWFLSPKIYLIFVGLFIILSLIFYLYSKNKAPLTKTALHGPSPSPSVQSSPIPKIPVIKRGGREVIIEKEIPQATQSAEPNKSNPTAGGGGNGKN